MPVFETFSAYQHRTFFMFLFLVFSLLLTCGIDFIGALKLRSPDAGRCPETDQMFDYCSTKYSSCNWNFNVCIDSFCECVENIKREKLDDGNCDEFLKTFCHNLKTDNRRKMEKERHQTFEIPEDVEQSCNSTHNPDESVIHRIVNINRMLKTGGSTLKLECDRAIMKMDSETNLAVPFSQFQCGWQLGYVGRAVSRIWIKDACGKYAIEINHCCAVQLNCALANKTEEYCDDEFQKCAKKKLWTMKTVQNSCEKFVNMSSTILQGVNLVQIGDKNSTETKIRIFNGNFHAPIEESETKLEIVPIRIIEVGSAHLPKVTLRKHINNEIIRNGWRDRVVVSSCLLLLEECLREDEQIGCLSGLQTCLNDISDQTEAFSASLKVLNEMVKEPEFVTMDQVKEMIKREERSLWSKIVEYFLIAIDTLAAGLYIGNKVFKWMKCRRENSMMETEMEPIATNGETSQHIAPNGETSPLIA